MKHRSRWTWVVLGAAGFLAALGITAAVLVPNSDELAARISATVEARVGVKMTIGAVRWQVFPYPVVVIENAATVQPQPITFKRLVATPRLHALLRRKLEIEHVEVEDAVLPQLSLRGMRIAAGDTPGVDAIPLEQISFTNLTWITRHGKALEFDGTASFDANWRPRHLELVRPGVQPLASLVMEREGSQDRWKAAVRVGGGTADGEVALASGKDGQLQLTGKLAPRGVEVDSAMASFKRNSAVKGRANGQTTLTASGANIAELARSLHTKTVFTIPAATILHIDVDKAIRSAGKDKAGQTPLSSLTGQMDTQNTPNGMVVSYSGIAAKGETFTATGDATIANRQVKAEMTVNIAGGLVGVPLKVTGSLDAPQVTVPTSAIAGAAIGTAIIPGVGTVIGARIGAAVGKMFGSDPGTAAKPVPGKPAAAPARQGPAPVVRAPD